jgi:hypothetical protein
MTLSKTVLLLLAVAGVLLLQHYYSLMPDTMASHFDGAGRPNGHQSKDGFFLLSGAMLVLTVVLFGGIGPLFRKIPVKWFSLPHRDYWLSPERREATLDFMVRQMEWFGAASLLLLILILREALAANLSPEPVLDSTSAWWWLGLYFLYTTIWLVRFLARFRKPDAA